MDETIPMQVGWVESIPGGPEGLGHVHTNRQYYPDMAVKSMVGNRASYRSAAPPRCTALGFSEAVCFF